MQEPVNKIVDHLFRHESGKMIAVLSKLLGLQNLGAAQDLTQDTLVQALYTWSYKGLPDNPTAWLYRVARNKAIDYLRREKTFRAVRAQHAVWLNEQYTVDPDGSLFEEGQIEDSLLRMMFACCHPAIPVESQIALVLKTLCGLSVPEIARAFLRDEETISKRVYRAREKIKAENIALELPLSHELPARLDAVLHALYLLFNEGYNSSQPEQLIREDLCEEAMRLAFLLTQTPATNLPRTNALLALFCFQASRLKARLGEQGNIILLKQQDRSKWYQPLISKGYFFLDTATQHETSIYHLEAAIAYLHAVAPSFEDTDWKAIYYLYQVLATEHPTPFILLNKAIAASYALDKRTALEALNNIQGLENYYLYHTAIGEIYFDLHEHEQALKHYQKALSLTRSVAEQQLLQQKLLACVNGFTPSEL
ncbi:sigma-70 family RNA polymerase sigma factor [Segetibacter sp. 3557_3]|uniref:RNA polymerase sigma factor n=1 Tax=Segetibacter sp. 3557_3 TaxID=2547429 RepID=UPI0010586C0A|nr:sigma-70 family RNA polymerase sigma factor [Segetibacter sp. 3557_3]TDH20668.1 sigma-70 family RNA polymerase sigma factor [Segetibacter sp. 3557_3]